MKLLERLGKSIMFNKMKCVRYLPNILFFALLKKATSLMKMSMQHLGGLTRDGILSFSLFTKKTSLDLSSQHGI